MASRLAKVIQGMYSACRKADSPYILYSIDEDDIRIWYILIAGLGDFPQGEFIFKLTVKDDFPAEPPRVEAYTPSGVFEPGGPICISIGEFHSKDKPGSTGSYGWRKILGISGFAISIVACLCGFDEKTEGIRVNVKSTVIKKELSLKSRETNRTKFNKQFNMFEEIIATSPELAAVQNILKTRALLNNVDVEQKQEQKDSTDELYEMFGL